MGNVSFAAGTAVTATDSTISSTALRPIILVPGTGGVQMTANANNYNPGDPFVWLDLVFPWGIDDDELIHNLKLKHSSSTVPYEVAPYNSDVNVWPTRTYDDLAAVSRMIDGGDSYMSTMVNDLRSKGYVPGQNLWAFSYDWRLEWKKHQAGLAARIDQALAASGSDKVYLFGHSQGTQVIETFLVDNPAYQSKVAGVINVGAPYKGAATTLRATAPALGGYDFGVDALGFGIEMATGLEIGKNAPAVYHMSPTAQYETDLKNSYGFAGSIEKREYRYNAFKTLLSSRFLGPTGDPHAYAQSHQADSWLASWTNTAHAAWDSKTYNVPLLNIAGYGHDTEVGYLIKNNIIEQWGAVLNRYTDVEYRFRDGDGTVPYISSTYWSSRSTRPYGSENFYVYGDHTKMVDPSMETDQNHEYYTVMDKTMNWIAKIGAYAASPTALSAPSIASVAPATEPVATKEKEMRPVREKYVVSFVAPRVDQTYEAVITDKKSGKQETVTISGKGKLIRDPKTKTDVLVKLATLPSIDDPEQLTLSMQFVMDSAKEYTVDLQSVEGDVEVFRGMYRTAQGETVERAVMDQVKLERKVPLKVQYGKGKSEFSIKGQPLK